MKIRYIAAILALASFSAHAALTLNGLQLNGWRLNGLNLNGLKLQNGLQLNGAPTTLAATNALIDLGSRPLIVQE